MEGAKFLESHPVVSKLDAERDQLHRAGDLIIKDLKERGQVLGDDQLEALFQVLGTVIEHTDCIELARVGVIGAHTSPEDPAVGLLIARASAISARILAAA